MNTKNRMDITKVSLVNTGKCSCCNPENNMKPARSLDDYTNDSVTITYFDHNTLESQKENIKIHIPTKTSTNK